MQTVDFSFDDPSVDRTAASGRVVRGRVLISDKDIAVVNERGETVIVVTLQDVLAAGAKPEPVRKPAEPVEPPPVEPPPGETVVAATAEPEAKKRRGL